MREIIFTKLFGRFNYHIKLKDDGITIITGPNGFGKSTILKCIDALKNGFEGIFYLMKLDFEKIEYIFDKEKVVIRKEEDRFFIDKSSFTMKDFYNNASRFVMKYGMYIRRRENDTIFDRRTGKEYTMEEYFSDKNLDEELFLNENFLESIFTKTIINKIKKIKAMVGQINFIKEQRLIAKKENSRQEDIAINIIEELPSKFKKLINETSAKYSEEANKYDSTYPYRLFNEKTGITKDEYNANMAEMKLKFNKLKEYDISEIDNNRKLEFKEQFSTALKIYFEDFKNKYKVYEELITKLDLFVSIVNSRLTFKKIKVSKEGIEIVDDNNKKLRLADLSSGEQQEIVLFYKLIFETEDESMLLIDEPEISLHIVWQKLFMDDLLKVVELKKIKVIVATHSPQIISNHWEKQIDLGELYGN